MIKSMVAAPGAGSEIYSVIRLLEQALLVQQLEMLWIMSYLEEILIKNGALKRV